MRKLIKKIIERVHYKNVSLTRNLSTRGEISVGQLKAARSLLDWSQADLAAKSGYSLPAINNIERGVYKAHSATINDIIQTFEQNGIQFISSGVRLENSDFQIKFYEGEDALHYLLTKVGAAFEAEGDLLISGIDETILKEKAGDDLKKCLSIIKQKHVQVRVLCHRADKGEVIFPNIKQKIVPDDVPLIPTFIYQGRVALVFLGNPIYVCILYNPSLFKTSVDSFEHLWKTTR
ncbi:MAG: helix-turn-helix transcriptional regulator [Alphaproteobacteria bacterium]|nr:helix-turn-helix transcriptional regulator [Alphaproteobacteria bacterium]